mmetsp:Transcript_70401/g.199613  ORF Transcript_70401/g.199613 Transcript_70401/m.199613 type:complete len:200 (+) Transcript_70401:10-609(+)
MAGQSRAPSHHVRRILRLADDGPLQHDLARRALLPRPLPRLLLLLLGLLLPGLILRLAFGRAPLEAPEVQEAKLAGEEHPDGEPGAPGDELALDEGLQERSERLVRVVQDKEGAAGRDCGGDRNAADAGVLDRLYALPEAEAGAPRVQDGDLVEDQAYDDVRDRHEDDDQRLRGELPHSLAIDVRGDDRRGHHRDGRRD